MSGHAAATSRHEAELVRLERLANLMDSAFTLPGTRIRLGLDSLIGLVPGIGDTAAILPAAYVIFSAHKLGAPGHIIARMMANSGIDLLVGSVPLLGDLFDVRFKANRRNVALLRDHFERAGVGFVGTGAGLRPMRDITPRRS
ncbi:MAG: DUF4112 domain-containing protein [Hyphomicrobiaceae bacterium]|nr:DUF4112 domain-containing protein [Hyphomicrobiaceae bacterium]